MSDKPLFSLSFVLGTITGIFFGATVFILSLSRDPFFAPSDLFFGWLSPEVELSLDAQARLEAAQRTFAEVLSMVEIHHVSESMDADLVTDMLNRSLGALDANSGYLSQEATRDLTQHSQGDGRRRLGLMGMDIGGAYVVEAVLEGGPAQKAGLRPGDRIVSVDGTDLRHMSVAQAHSSLSKAVANATFGTVALSIERGGVRMPGTFPVQAEAIPSAAAYNLGRVDDVLHIHLSRFHDGAANEVDRIIARELRLAPLKGVVIDLRGNTGGLTLEAQGLAGLFFEDGTLLYSMLGKSVDEQVRTEGAPPYGDLAIAVITNRQSASASEIFASAVQVHKRGVVVGWRSLGKGSVQRIFPIESGAVKITVAEYFDASGAKIQGFGVHPDVAIDMPDPQQRVSRFLRAPARRAAVDWILAHGR